jgi:glutamate-ammonia-ligase adenylyltransferase
MELMADQWQGALERAREHAPFLARALDRQSELADLLERGEAGAALEWASSAGKDAEDVGAALRKERLALATTLAIGDLAGAFPLQDVMQRLSDFADRALDAAIGDAINVRVDDWSGDISTCGFVALALGKQGAHELNYSSDIDPILLFDPDTLPRRASDEPAEAAQRYARHIVRTLSDLTAEGYVFRVDLRLRPASEISPPAVPFASALAHYQSSALAWERAAFIRARAAAGDIARGESFLDAIDPFVWRSAVDFGAVEEVRLLTRRIRDHYEGPADIGPGFNLKQGRGGIREIEFFAQTHQLVHGGRDPSLRLRGTRDALDALAMAERISGKQATQLGQSYDRLRVLEHRLQMVEDRQTHSLPDADALERLAQLDGLTGAGALIDELRAITDQVAECYDGLIAAESKPAAVPVAPEPLAQHLQTLCFAEPDRLAKRINGWRDGRYQSLRSDAALAAFDAMLPRLLEALANAEDLDRALARWESVLANASSAINLFRLLEARPELLDRLIAVLTLAPPLADALGQRPQLLDALIDGSALALPGCVEELATDMRLDAHDADYELQLDRIRQVTSETRFALGVQLIESLHDPLEIAAGLSRLAQAGLQVASEAARREFALAYGEVAGAELLVLGLGRFGGGMLTHASDLDIVYLFSGAFDAVSNGERSLGATQYFNRLASRVTAALSVPTAQGALYEVDTRLRPQGSQGPLAVTISSFAKYQMESAWSWEHMALTRARVLLGSESAAAQLDAKVSGVLLQSRDTKQLRNDVLNMRVDMAAHKAPQGELDVKLLRGGLVDIEFCVHFLQLSEGKGLKPHLGEALEELIAGGMVSADLLESWRDLTRILVASRLLAPDKLAPSPAAASALAKACNADDYNSLLRRIAKARQSTAENWQAVFGEKLELSG